MSAFWRCRRCRGDKVEKVGESIDGAVATFKCLSCQHWFVAPNLRKTYSFMRDGTTRLSRDFSSAEQQCEMIRQRLAVARGGEAAKNLLMKRRYDMEKTMRAAGIHDYGDLVAALQTIREETERAMREKDRHSS